MAVGKLLFFKTLHVYLLKKILLQHYGVIKIRCV